MNRREKLDELLLEQDRARTGWVRVEVARVADIVTMDYEGGRRLRPADPPSPHSYYLIIGISPGGKEVQLARHGRRSAALKIGQKLAANIGAAFMDDTGGR